MEHFSIHNSQWFVTTLLSRPLFSLFAPVQTNWLRPSCRAGPGSAVRRRSDPSRLNSNDEFSRCSNPFQPFCRVAKLRDAHTHLVHERKVKAARAAVVV